MRQVTLYTAAGCARCDEAREELRVLGVEFTEIDVRTDPLALHRAILFSGAAALPAVDVDGDVLVGLDRERLRELLGVPAPGGDGENDSRGESAAPSDPISEV